MTTTALARSIFPCVLAAVLLLAPSTVSAKERWTPFHVAELRGVSSAVLSPDGRHVAHVLSVPRDPFEGEDGAAYSELHVVGPDRKSRGFITGKVSIGSVSWTPDGTGIAFLDKRDGDDEKSLYVIPVDGGEARRVLSHESGISSYSFAADGLTVAFLATPKESEERKKLRDKGFKQEIYEEEWRPAEVWIARICDEKSEPRKLELPGSASSIEFSPDGKKLALAVAPTSMVDDSYMRRRAKIVDVASGTIVAAIANPGKLGELAWSPDSSHLAMISAIDINDPSEGRLFVVSEKGGDLTEILPAFPGQVADIAWQDAETIMYLADIGCETLFGEVRIDGSGKKLHIPAGGPVFGSFSLSKDGRSAAFVGQSPTHPSEVYTMVHGDTAPTRLTFSNAWLPNMEFARQEVVEYRARDGLRLQGILVHPLEEQEGTRYPLILTVHGGPESHYQNGWITAYSMAGQVGAANGFAVFYPNYRGSTGRGVPFSKLSQGDPAGKEFDDYVDGVDHLVATGLVDRARVGITGGSYGGYATAWGSTYHTDHFAAGVMFVGISDKISKWGTSDIPYELFAVHDRHYPWEDWDLFREASPVTYAPQSRTALLILHGKDDPRVHPSQSLELYRYLNVIGKTPVRLVWYPGEGHGNRKAAARLDYSLRLMQWMTHYLMGPGGEKPDPELSYEDPRENAPGARPID